MKGSRVSNDENNYRGKKCPCPGNKDYSQRGTRTPLGDIQDIGTQKRIGIESTRVSTAPHIKEPLTKIIPTVTVRPLQKGELQKLLAQAPLKVTKSGSCRCPGSQSRISETVGRESSGSSLNRDGCVDQYSQMSYENSSDHVFLKPLSSTRVRSHSKSRNTPSPSQNSISSSHHSLSSSSSNSSSRSDKSPSSTTLKARSVGNASDENSLRSISSKQGSIMTTSQNSSSSKRVQGCCSTRVIHKDTLRSPIEHRNSFRPLSTSSSIDLTSSSSRSSATLDPSGHQSSSSRMSYSSSQANPLRSSCSPSQSINKPRNSSARYTTLPSQHFETLTQDTLHSTASRSSVLNSMTSALSKVSTVRDSSFFPDDDRTFLDAETFFRDLDQGKSSTIRTIPVFSPPKVDIPVRRSTSTNESSRPAVKTTLKRRSSIKNQSFPLLFSPEYIEDIIAYSYKSANNFVLKSEWVEAYVDKRYRTFTVNWLLQITEIISPHFEPVYYMTVRIFDYAIVRLRLRKGHYQLAAIVAFWISLKYVDNTIALKIPKIFSLCYGKNSKAEILHMERVILKSLKYCLNVSDPLDFLYNYLKSSNLENNQLLKYGSEFILECATLFESYPLARIPFIAASALYLAYKVIFKTNDVYVNFMWFERKTVEKYAHSVLTVNVKYVIMEKYEPLNKYLAPEKLSVAKEFFNL